MTEINLLLSYLHKLAPLDSAMEAYLQNNVSINNYPKGYILKSNGITSDRIWFVGKGLLKSRHFDQNGKQIVTRFWTEYEMILLKRKNGAATDTEQIVLLEDSILLTLTNHQLEVLYTDFHRVHQITRRIYLSELRKRDIRPSLLVMPAADAYANFCHLFPCQRLLLQDIAYYLNIRPYSLSRIRRLK